MTEWGGVGGCAVLCVTVGMKNIKLSIAIFCMPFLLDILVHGKV